MRGVYRAQSHPAAIQNRRLRLSPIDLSVDLVIGGRLCCQVPVRLDRNTLNRLRIAVIPQRWPACRRYVRGLGVHPDVIEALPDLCALGDKCDQAHLPTAHWAQQREHLVDAGDQRRPQVMRG